MVFEIPFHFSRCEEEIVKLKEQNKSLEEQVADYEVEVTERKDKQQEILLYSQNLTESNVSSKAMATDLQFKVCLRCNMLSALTKHHFGGRIFISKAVEFIYLFLFFNEN